MAAIDTRTIRQATYAQLRDYYTTLSQNVSSELITSELLEAIERGSITPMAFAPWLGSSRSPAVIHAAFVQSTSITVRKLATKQLRLALCSRKWKETLSKMGDASGFLEIFSNLSVIEVREACRAIGSVAKGHDVTEKRLFVTNLFEALMGPNFFPDAKFKSKDDRPLRKYYMMLVQSCEERIVDMAVKADFKGVWENVRIKGLMQFHPAYMQRLCTMKVKDGVAGDTEKEHLKRLTQHYPPRSTDTKGVSAPMEYAFSVLEILVETERHLLPFDFVVEDLILPLLRNALKKKAEIETLARILDIFLNYLDTHRKIGIKLTHMVGPPSIPVAQCWARNPSYFDDRIKRFNLGEFDDWGGAMVWVPRHKYQFMRLCILQSTGLDIDIDADLKNVRLTLDSWLLDSLSAEQAFELFTRLRAARGDDTLLGSSHGSILNTSKSFANEGSNYKDADIYNIWLHTRVGRVEAATELATLFVEEFKSKAHISPDPEERAFYVRKVLYTATASGSLHMLEATHAWSKRFIRDPLTMAALDLHNEILEMTRLLTGIPEKFDETFSDASMFRQRLNKSNSILVGMFDMACQALQEPHFQSDNWIWVYKTIGAVAMERIKLAPEFRKILQMSETDFFELMWRPTIDMLIEVERKARQEGHERLNINHLTTTFSRNAMIYHVKEDQEVSTYMFVDEYAKARDSLWQSIRLRIYPRVATLPDSFPRGLPIQCCGPWNILDLDEHAPYIASRVRATLFPDPATALQPVNDKDEPQMKAIGRFVDDYASALNLYVPHRCPLDEAQKRLEKVWTYATTHLSRDMTEEEAFSFWRKASNTSSWIRNHRLRDLWPPRTKVPRKVDWPSLPDVDNALGPMDWNPLGNMPGHPARELGPVTYLDMSLQRLSQSYAGIHEKLEKITPTVPGDEREAHELWKGSITENRKDPDHRWSLVQRNRLNEASVLSALLYIERRFVDEEHHLLRTPFPSEDDARYPAMRLADETYKADGLNIFSAERDLKDEVDRIPPVLLEKLAKEVLKVLSTVDRTDSAYITIHEVAIMLIVRLGESDRPALATELAVNTVLERPQSSSWHRQLLKFKFFRRLSAQDARACCDYFAERLIENMAHDTIETESGENKDNKRRVKVTTVKLLVQIMAGTDFVGEEYALNLLAAISQKVTHVDVKATVVKGLLKMLPNATDEQVEKLLANLEAFVSTAGNLNERKPLTDQDWEEYEANLALPEIEQSHFSTIFTELLSHFELGPSEARYFPTFVNRILLPAVSGLEQQTARWAKLFVKKYADGNTELEALGLPLIPREYGTCGRILAADNSRVCFLPRRLLESYTRYLAFNVAPPAPFRTWMKSLTDDLKNTPHQHTRRKDIGTFTDLFNRGAPVLSTLRANNILLHLPMETKLPLETGITPHALQTHYLTLFTAATHGDAPLYHNLNSHIVNELLMPEYVAQPWWRPHARPILEAMVLYTRQLRTRDWDRDPKRSPAVLPDTFRWTLAMLDFPYPPATDVEADPLLSLDRDQECAGFADRLSTLIEGMGTQISGEGMSFRRLSALKTYLTQEPVGGQHQQINRSIGWREKAWVDVNHRHSEFQERRVLIATSLGDVQNGAKRRKLSWVSGPDVLRVEVTRWIIEMVSGDEVERMSDSVRTGWRDVVRGWVECESEEVRRAGIETAGRMFGGVEGLNKSKPMEEKRRVEREASRGLFMGGRGRGLFRGGRGRGRGGW